MRQVSKINLQSNKCCFRVREQLRIITLAQDDRTAGIPGNRTHQLSSKVQSLKKPIISGNLIESSWKNGMEELLISTAPVVLLRHII